MMKGFVLGLALVGLLVTTGCTTTNKVLTKNVYVAVSVPDNLFNCPQIRKMDFPDPKTATNQQVADFLTKLYRYNRQCGNSERAVKKYIDEYEKRIVELNRAG